MGDGEEDGELSNLAEDVGNNCGLVVLLPQLQRLSMMVAYSGALVGGWVGGWVAHHDIAASQKGDSGRLYNYS